jgi:hypothetical protein
VDDKKYDLKDNYEYTEIRIEIIIRRHFVFIDSFVMIQIDRYEPA